MSSVANGITINRYELANMFFGCRQLAEVLLNVENSRSLVSMVDETCSDNEISKNARKNQSFSYSICHVVDPKDLATLWNPLNWEYKEFICGWGAAFINICITYPLNKVTFRQMLHNLGPVSAIKQISNEGIYVLYRGILPPLCQKTTSLSLMFGVYEGARKPLCGIVSENTAKVIAALLSGTTEAILTPFERIQTLLQDQKYHDRFKNTKDSFRQIYKLYGFKEYYRGLTPILLRNGPSNVCYFFLRDEIKNIMEKNESWYGRMSKEFILGGVIGAVISTFFYPLNVLKVHLQSKLGGDYQNIFSAVSEIYHKRGGISSFYKGVHLNYTRGFISWGIITVSSETIRRLISPEL